MPKLIHSYLHFIIMGLLLTGGAWGCIAGNQGGGEGEAEVAVEYQDSQGQAVEAPEKVFLSGETGDPGSDSEFRSGTAEAPSGAERVGSPEGEGTVTEPAPLYEIYNPRIKMEAMAIPHPLEGYHSEAELRELEETLPLEQILSWIESLKIKLSNLEGTLNVIRGQNRTQAHHEDETGVERTNRDVESDFSNTQRSINETKGEILRYQQIWDRRATVDDIDKRIAGLNSELEALRSTENSYRGNIAHLTRVGAGEAEIQRNQARLDEVLDKIGEVSRQISTLEILRRDKV